MFGILILTDNRMMLLPTLLGVTVLPQDNSGEKMEENYGRGQTWWRVGGRKLGGIRDWKSKVVGEPGTRNLKPGTRRGRLERQSRSCHSSQLELTCAQCACACAQCAHKGCCQKPIVSDKQSLQILCTGEIGQRKKELRDVFTKHFLEPFK